MASTANAKLLSGATPEDLAKCARQIGSDAQILAVWRVPEESRQSAACSFIPAPLVMLPCFW